MSEFDRRISLTGIIKMSDFDRQSEQAFENRATINVILQKEKFICSILIVEYLEPIFPTYFFFTVVNV